MDQTKTYEIGDPVIVTAPGHAWYGRLAMVTGLVVKGPGIILYGLRCGNERTCAYGDEVAQDE